MIEFLNMSFSDELKLATQSSDVYIDQFNKDQNSKLQSEIVYTAQRIYTELKRIFLDAAMQGKNTSKEGHNHITVKYIVPFHICSIYMKEKDAFSSSEFGNNTLAYLLVDKIYETKTSLFSGKRITRYVYKVKLSDKAFLLLNQINNLGVVDKINCKMRICQRLNYDDSQVSFFESKEIRIKDEWDAPKTRHFFISFIAEIDY